MKQERQESTGVYEKNNQRIIRDRKTERESKRQRKRNRQTKERKNPLKAKR